MSALTPMAPLAVAFAVTAAATWILMQPRLARLVLDRPNDRSLHVRPVPRIGGLGMVLGVAAGWVVAGSDLPVPLVAAVLLLVAISLVDDARAAPIAVRFGAHFAAAAMVVVPWAHDAIGALPAALLVVAVVWFTNLYNFMDGSDGLAGGMAVFGFGTFAIAAALQGDAGFAIAAGCIAAAAAAFLLFNFHPARVFMGDAGSIPLGFLAASLGLLGWRIDLWPLWFPVLVFSPFVIDASVTLARRVLRGERFWRPHRSHYYQRLVQLGWGHRRTALAEYALMLGCAAAAVWAMRQPPAVQLTVLGIAAVGYAVLAVLVDAAWQRRAPEG